MVESLAKGRLGEAEVIRVAVQEDRDWMGDTFIDVMVVWDDTASKFDVDKAASFKRDLRAALDEKDGSPFPVITFMAKSEDAELA